MQECGFSISSTPDRIDQRQLVQSFGEVGRCKTRQHRQIFFRQNTENKTQLGQTRAYYAIKQHWEQLSQLKDDVAKWQSEGSA